MKYGQEGRSTPSLCGRDFLYGLNTSIVLRLVTIGVGEIEQGFLIGPTIVGHAIGNPEGRRILTFDKGLQKARAVSVAPPDSGPLRGRSS